MIKFLFHAAADPPVYIIFITYALSETTLTHFLHGVLRWCEIWKE
jgi:hypothetical protein